MIPASRIESFARWTGVSLILFTILGRVMTSPSRLPYWDIDPVSSWTPDTSRTPAMGLLFDALVWLATAMIVWARGRTGRALPWGTGVLALIGCVGVALHGWVLTPLVAAGGSPPTHGDFESLTLGSAWASAIVGAWALASAAREPGVRRCAVGALLGVVVMLAAKGAMQVFADHPRLVADFEKNKDAMLASQGFEPGSANARLFERRLRQAEATGWFGLANVYGSVTAAGLAAFLALAIGATRAVRSNPKDGSVGPSHWRTSRQWRPNPGSSRQWRPTGGEAGLMWLAAIAAGFALALSGSKGAIGAGLVGCGCVGLWWWMRGPRQEAATVSSKWRMLLRAAPIALPALALVAVAVRGLLGERIGELSLYFRWQYLLAAARIIAAHPIFGVGPAGFKDQYLLHKEPTNPEEIDSPHSLLFDWTATLGVFGIAWGALFIAWLWRAGGLHSESTKRVNGSIRGFVEDSSASASVAALGIVGASVAFLMWCEWEAIGPDVLLVYLLAAAGWWCAAVVAGRVASADGEALRCALFAAAVVLGTHAMIEVTGVWRSSAAWMLAAVALAANGSEEPRAEARRRRIGTAVGIALAAGGVIGFWSGKTFVEEHRLQRAANEASNAVSSDGQVDVASLRAAVNMLNTSPTRWMIGPSIDSLEPRQRLGWMIALASGAEQRDEAVRKIRGMLMEATSGKPRSAAAWARSASLYEAVSTLPRTPSVRTSAVDGWLKAAELDPHGLAPALHLARLFALMDRPVEAARWARRALEINRNLRLDPLKGLTHSEQAEMERIAGG